MSTTTFERENKTKHENETIKSLRQGYLDMIFLKPQNKNNDLAR